MLTLYEESSPKPPTSCDWYRKGFCSLDGKPCPYYEENYTECVKWQEATQRGWDVPEKRESLHESEAVDILVDHLTFLPQTQKGLVWCERQLGMGLLFWENPYHVALVETLGDAVALALSQGLEVAMQ